MTSIRAHGSGLGMGMGAAAAAVATSLAFGLACPYSCITAAAHLLASPNKVSPCFMLSFSGTALFGKLATITDGRQRNAESERQQQEQQQ